MPADASPPEGTPPTDTEMFDWLEREQCSLTCYRVFPNAEAEDDNGWIVDGADSEQRREPSGKTAREAIAWAMKLHTQGKFRTRRDELLAEESDD